MSPLSTASNSNSLYRSQKVHLVVIIHGLWGSPDHVSYLANTLRRFTDPSSQGINDPLVEILLPTSIQWTNTYDGIDFCAELVLQELDQKIKELELDGKQLIKFSCIGYSLGGLISRFLIGLLHSRKPSFFDRVEPMNFNTFASPWIGMPRYKTIVSSVMNFFGSRLLSRTGNQLYLIDKYHKLPHSKNDQDERKREKKYPLIGLLAHPETNFYKALLKFKVVKIYANSINDRTVPFVTGAFERFDLFQISRQIATQSKFIKNHADLNQLELLSVGGLDLTFNNSYPCLLERVQSVTKGESEPSSGEVFRTEHSKTTTTTTVVRWNRNLPKLPFFLKPSTYPYKAPLNYLAAGFSPLIAPIFLAYIFCSFCYQSYQSKKRIQKYQVGELEFHESRLKKVGLFQELEQDLVEDLAGIGNQSSLEEAYPAQPNLIDSQISPQSESHDSSSSSNPFLTNSAPLLSPSDSIHPGKENLPHPTLNHRLQHGSRSSSEGTQYLTDLSEDMTSIKHDLGLSKLQIEMLDHLNQLPNLIKHFVFLDEIPNSHGAIIYRAEGLSDRRGKKVVAHWAEGFML